MEDIKAIYHGNLVTRRKRWLDWEEIGKLEVEKGERVKEKRKESGSKGEFWVNLVSRGGQNRYSLL